MTVRRSRGEHVSTVSGSLHPTDPSIDTPEPVAVRSSASAASMMAMVQRFGWALADQLLSSATNFLLAVLVARTVGARDLGAFTVAYATFTFSLGAVRAIAGELLVVRYSAVPADEWRSGVRAAAGTAVIAGIVIGTACLAAAATVGGSVASVLSIVAVFLPALLVQDVWRFAFFARGRGGAAFLNDAVWVVAMCSAFVLLNASYLSSVTSLTVGWASAGALAAIFGLFQLGLLPSSPSTALRWLRQHREIAPRFFAEFVIGSGVSNVTLFSIGGIAGLGELGRLRAGEIALGPLNVLFPGVALVATPEGVRRLQESRRRLTRLCRRLSLGLAAGVMAWGALILMVPQSIGEMILAENWGAARSLLPPLLVALAAYGSCFGAWTGLRALAAARRSLRARCVDGLLTVSFGLTGAYVAGATGVAWGYAVAGCLRSVNVWWQFSRALREHDDIQKTRAPRQLSQREPVNADT